MNERAFTLTREIGASREDVWASWTDPAELHWFFSGQQDPGEEVSVDLRVGGAWRLLMVVSENTRYVTGGVYREIVPGERLVFSWGAVDGWPAIDPSDLDTVPLTTVELSAIPTGTKLSLTASFPDRISDAAAQEWLESGMREGWGMTIDRLVEKFATN
jgi:uncharacterized protein YndB with AHSA1/START domain